MTEDEIRNACEQIVHGVTALVYHGGREAAAETLMRLAKRVAAGAYVEGPEAEAGVAGHA